MLKEEKGYGEGRVTSKTQPTYVFCFSSRVTPGAVLMLVLSMLRSPVPEDMFALWMEVTALLEVIGALRTTFEVILNTSGSSMSGDI